MNNGSTPCCIELDGKYTVNDVTQMLMPWRVNPRGVRASKDRLQDLTPSPLQAITGGYGNAVPEQKARPPTHPRRVDAMVRPGFGANVAEAAV